MLAVLFPFGDYCGHIFGEFAFKIHLLFCGGMNEAKLLCMQGMAGANGKTIVNKLLVFCEHGAFYNSVAAIKIIIKYGVTNELHVHTNLVGATGLKPALNKGYIVIAL